MGSVATFTDGPHRNIHAQDLDFTCLATPRPCFHPSKIAFRLAEGHMNSVGRHGNTMCYVAVAWLIGLLLKEQKGGRAADDHVQVHVAVVGAQVDMPASIRRPQEYPRATLQ